MAMPISSVAAEYAPKVLWSSMYRECTSNVSVWDTPGKPEETMMTAPNSPSERATVNTIPYVKPQRIAGKVIRQNVCQPEAPSVAAACSCSSPIS